uniref:Uncharacterized protein n=1 Tax=Romanomermis culicivorax TaxID=13658 RepID=A0A915KB87_ROMCU
PRHQQRRLRSGHNSRSSTTTTTTIAANGRSSNGGSGNNIITARCTDCYLYHSAGDKCQSPTVHSSSSCNGSGLLLTSASLKRQNQKMSKFNGKNSTSKQDLTSSEAGAGQYPKKSFRYLYQARRRHGDVICQSYMESLQKLSNQRRFGATSVDLNTPTMISDRTQLTILSTGSNSNSNGSV